MVADVKEHAKLTGLYKYCWLLKPPSQPGVHVPYNLLTYLAKVAPKGSETEYVVDKLRGYGYVRDEMPEDLEKRIEYAFNWTRDFMEIRERAVKLSEKEAAAVKELIQALQVEVEEDQIQGAVFTIARKHSLSPRRFFKTLYAILLGVPEGPRFGPYIVSMGRRNVTEALERALKK